MFVMPFVEGGDPIERKGTLSEYVYLEHGAHW
ncbi:MAG: DUF475 domain-containing protein, partial [Nocardia sp.]|nr:DUF475 domain-containing protein [Nocardia sp.]